MTALKFSGVVLPGGEHTDLYVVNGHVTYEPFPGAEVVSAQGWIVPGLVDAHCHIGLADEGQPLATREQTEAMAVADRDSGVLLARDAGVNTDTRWVQEREDLPRLIRCGRHVARTARYMRGYAVEVEPEDLVAAVRRQAADSDGWIKLVGDWIDRAAGDLTPSFDADDFAAAVAAAHAAGVKVTAHCMGAEVLPGLVRAGIDCIEHGTGLDLDLIDDLAARGTALVPTVVQMQSALASNSRVEKYPVFAARNGRMAASWAETVMSAVEAGVPVYAGTDGVGRRVHGAIAEEILAMRALGMSAGTALGAASWHARAWLGLTPDLREGAEADFVVYDRDPLADLSVVAEPALVVLRGSVFLR